MIATLAVVAGIALTMMIAAMIVLTTSIAVIFVIITFFLLNIFIFNLLKTRRPSGIAAGTVLSSNMRAVLLV